MCLRKRIDERQEAERLLAVLKGVCDDCQKKAEEKRDEFDTLNGRISVLDRKKEYAESCGVKDGLAAVLSEKQRMVSSLALLTRGLSIAECNADVIRKLYDCLFICYENARYGIVRDYLKKDVFARSVISSGTIDYLRLDPAIRQLEEIISDLSSRAETSNARLIKELTADVDVLKQLGKRAEQLKTDGDANQ